jgi:hypothetical protein
MMMGFAAKVLITIGYGCGGRRLPLEGPNSSMPIFYLLSATYLCRVVGTIFFEFHMQYLFCIASPLCSVIKELQQCLCIDFECWHVNNLFNEISRRIQILI